MRKDVSIKPGPWLFFFCLWGALGAIPHNALANRSIHLATTEREPYIGKHLPAKGYVHELITLVFKNAGYTVIIDFYPLERARKMALAGKLDGLFPYPYQESATDRLAFSEPFPGDQIGLLKNKSLSVALSPKAEIFERDTLYRLREYTFGQVRGASVSPAFDEATFLKKDQVTTDLQNIHKLIKGRIDFAIIDKYTAADLITHHLPHLIGQLEFLGQTFVSKPFHIAFSRQADGYAKKLSDFNHSLKEATDDGTVVELTSRHGFFPPKIDVPGKVTLTIATVDNADMTIMRRLSAGYEFAHPDITLDWKVLDENTLRRRLISDLAINAGQFDIMTIGAFEAPIWAAMKRLIPIDDLPLEYAPDDLLAPVVKMLSHAGRLYALPFYGESSMTFYRQDLFDSAGLTMPDAPTYADIEHFAARLHDPENEIYGLCLRGKPGWGANMCYFNTLVNTSGGRWFDENWNPTIDTPEWKAALTRYKRLVDRYGPPDTVDNNFNENLALFSNGHCAMWIDATVAAGLLFNPNYSSVHDRLGFASAPIATTEKGARWLYAWSLAVPTSSRYPGKAMAFIRWATSKEYIRRVAEQEGWLAIPPGTRLSTYQNDNYRSAAPFADFVLEAIENADITDNTIKPSPYNGIQFVGIPEYPALGNQVGNRIARVLSGQLSIDQALGQAQQIVARQMEKSNRVILPPDRTDSVAEP